MSLIRKEIDPLHSITLCKTYSIHLFYKLIVLFNLEFEIRSLRTTPKHYCFQSSW